MAIAETARLIASLELKDLFSKPLSNATKGLDKFDKRVDQSASRSYKAGQQIGNGIKNSAKLIVGASVIVGAAIAGIAVKSIRAASDLNETVSKVGVVFGKAGASVLAFGKQAATGLGLSENAADAAAATYGNLFVSMGLTQKKSADMSIALVKLAGDLASFNNIDPAEALEKLRAGLTGESEPLKTLGININEQTLKAKALELGLVHLTKGQKNYTAVLTPAVKAQAAYALIFEQSKTAQGDFARTSGGLANQIRILKAQFETLAATIGTKALPQVAKIFQAINAQLAKPATLAAVEKLGDALAGLFSDENIQSGIKTISGAFDTVVAAAPILQATASATLGIVKAAVSLFTSLPPEIQALAAGAFAVNKLTGGLVTNVTGGIADVLAKKLGLTRGSSPATPLYVSDVSGGLGGAAGAAGAVGKGAGLLGTALKALPWIGFGLLIAEGFSNANTASGFAGLPAGTQTSGRFGPAPVGGGTGSRPLAPTILDRGGREAGTPGIAGLITKNIRNVLDAVRATFKTGFQRMVDALHNARGTAEITKALKEANRLVIQGHKGSAANTAKTISGLKAALQHTSDPKLQAQIRASLAKVQSLLPGRQFAARQLAAANAALRDGKLSLTEERALKRSAEALRNRGLPHAASEITKKINEAKKAQVTATNKVAEKIENQKFSVAITGQVLVSLRNLAYTSTVAAQVHAGGAPGAYRPPSKP
jgi:hypothetical protein